MLSRSTNVTSTTIMRWPRAIVLLLIVALGGCAGLASVPGLGKSESQAPRPHGPDSQVLGEVDELPKNLPKVRADNRDAFDRAVLAMEQQQWQVAEPLLRQVTMDQPKLAGPWINLGQVYLALEAPEEAGLAFRQAIAANPANCTAHNQLGVLARQLGDFASAEVHYKKCLSAKPDYEDAYLNLGILYELYLGRLNEALAAYRQYQQLIDTPDRKVQGWVMDLERRLGV